MTQPAHTPQRADASPNAARLPRRIALIHRSSPAQYVREEDQMVMTFPNLVVREAIALEILLIGLGLLAIFFDAPLESLANPNKTPNPAKAPWYFLGLQELLHYFPPVVAGVLVPTLAVIALVAIPYFRVNMEREPLWQRRTPKRLAIFLSASAICAGILAVFHCYILAVPLVIFAAVMASLYVPADRGLWKALDKWTASSGGAARVYAKLSVCSLAVWLMSWFLTAVVVLTVTGSLFRGPGWSFVWPWK
jgi:menaquinol-cytochrome c reductase cytochrome b/c subunit